MLLVLTVFEVMGGCSTAPPLSVDAAAEEVDVSPPVDAAMEVGPTPACAVGVDDQRSVRSSNPATGCPFVVDITHPYSSPSACDSVRACCAFPPSCEFRVDVRLVIPGACGGLERLPPAVTSNSGCRCVAGLIVCDRPWLGADHTILANGCLDCFLSPPDAATGGDVPDDAAEDDVSFDTGP